MAKVTRNVHVNVVTFDPAQRALIPVPGARLLCEDSGLLWDPDLSTGTPTTDAQGAATVEISFEDTDEESLNPFFTITVPTAARTVPAGAPAARQFQLPEEWVTRHYVNRRIRRITDHADPNKPLRLFVGLPAHLRVAYADFDASGKRNPVALPRETARIFLADYDDFLWIDFLNPDDTLTGAGFDPVAGRSVTAGSGDSYPYADEWPTVPYAQAVPAGTPTPLTVDPPGAPVGVLGGGSFLATGAVATDPHGFVFVLDGDLVRRFHPDGTLCETIPAPGGPSLSAPRGLALDQHANLFVADTGHDRIVFFAPAWADGESGRYEPAGTFGGAGAGSGQFRTPQGLAVIDSPQVDGEDRLAVADTGNNRVQVLSIAPVAVSATRTPRALFPRTLGLAFLQSFGAAAQFPDPVGVAADRAGRLFVCDRAAHRVSRWAPGTPAYTHEVDWEKTGGGAGAGPREFDAPAGLAVDTAAGQVYVADAGNHRVQRLDTETGAHLATWTPPGAGFTPAAIAVDARREVYVTNSAAPAVVRGTPFAATGQPQPDAAPPAVVGTAWTPAGDPAHLREPGYVAVGPDGTLWVTDTGNDRVLAFARDASGRLVPAAAPPPAGLTRPVGVAVDPGGGLFVVDSGNDRVRRYTAALAHQADLGVSGSGDAQLDDPRGIAVAQRTEPTLYVADTANNRVQILRRDGTFTGRLTTAGGQPLKAPEDVAVDAEGNVYVADTGNARIVQFDPADVFVRAFAAPALNPSVSGPAPCGVSVDDEGKLVVTDRAQNTVYRLEPDGVVLAYWDLRVLPRMKVSSPEVFYEPDLARQQLPDRPARAVVDDRGLLAIADTGHDRVRLVRTFTRVDVNLFDLGERLPDLSFRAVTKRDWSAELGLKLNVGDVSIFDDSHDFVAEPIDDFSDDEVVQRRTLTGARSTSAAINVMRVVREVQAWYQHHTRRDEAAHRWGPSGSSRTLNVDLTSGDNSYQFLDVNLGEDGHDGRGSDAWDDAVVAHEMTHWVFFKALQPYPPFSVAGSLEMIRSHGVGLIGSFNQTLTEGWPDLVEMRWGAEYGSVDRIRGMPIAGRSTLTSLRDRGSSSAPRRHLFGGPDSAPPTFTDADVAQRNEGYFSNALFQLYGALVAPGVRFADDPSFWHRFNTRLDDAASDRFTGTIWRALRDFGLDPPQGDLDKGSLVYVRSLLRRCRALGDDAGELAQSIMELNNVACPVVELRDGTPSAPDARLGATVTVTAGQAKTFLVRVTDLAGAPLRGYHLRFATGNPARYTLPAGPGPVARHGRRPVPGAAVPAGELHRATTVEGTVSVTYTAPAGAAGGTDLLRVTYQPDFDIDDSFAPPAKGDDRETTLRRAYLHELRGAAKVWPGAGSNFGAEIAASVTFRIQGA